jgi:uncharacterized membrane protein YbhN (UPF0104 family)/tRNA A-37 threonylcarbamoyl transferase component Bud32
VTDRLHLTARPTWGTLFGVVPDRGMRRRPSEVARVILGALVVALGAVAARNLSHIEVVFRDLVQALPDAILEGLKVLNGAGALISVLVVLGAALAARRIRFIGGVVVAAGLSAVVTHGLQQLVDAPGSVAGSAAVAGTYPDYPNMRLAVLAAVFFVAAPELTRPARRIQWLLLVLVSVSVVSVTDGYPAGVLGSLALGWAVAALVDLAFGSPDGVPDPTQVHADAVELGVELGPLVASSAQVWGEQALESATADGAVRVVVIGRDATDAQFLAKLFRFLWYKDSGPSLALSRTRQIEHRAYLLLLAERAAIPAPTVVVAGSAGGGKDALLVLAQAPGRPLDEVPSAEVTDEVLRSAWSALDLLHGAGISHKGLAPGGLRLLDDGRVAFTDLATADAAAEQDALAADRAALLVILAATAGEDRAITSARIALGDDGLTTVLPLLQAAALPRPLQRSVDDVRHLVGRLRDGVAGELGVEPPALVKLHRVSIANILMAAGTILGVYLLIGQLSEVDFATVFQDANWAWLPVIIVFSQLPQIGNSIAMLGSVLQPLPLRPVVGVNFANQFTGLVGGSVANAALAIRFFQRQGMTAAVAVSSGVLVSIAALIVQAILVVTGLLTVASTFSWNDSASSSSGSGSSDTQTFIAILLVVALLVGVATFVPRIRRRVTKAVMPQLRSARDNLSGIVRNPHKALGLFGGNVISQVFFALTLWAALECYGQSLGLMQLIVINSFASVLGGIMPVPGGMGVIEAGLIGGFTAAGIPQEQAVAATFTARLFTAYLPPIWGWFALNWLRRGEYI